MTCGAALCMAKCEGFYLNLLFFWFSLSLFLSCKSAVRMDGGDLIFTESWSSKYCSHTFTWRRECAHSAHTQFLFSSSFSLSSALDSTVFRYTSTYLFCPRLATLDENNYYVKKNSLIRWMSEWMGIMSTGAYEAICLHQPFCGW